MELAAQIAALRKKHGFSQEELGEKLGVSRQAVSKWESGQAVPELEKLKELSRIFGVSLNELLQLEESSPKKTEGAFLFEQPEKNAEKQTESGEGKLKKQRNWIFIFTVSGFILALALITICLQAQIKNLDSRLADVQSSLLGVKSEWSTAISSLRASIEQSLESQSSIVSDYHYDVISLQPISQRVKAKFTVTPKNSTADTTAVLSFTGPDFEPFTQELSRTGGGAFEGSADLPLSHEVRVQVTFLNGDERTNEALETIYGLDDYLLSIYSTFPGDMSRYAIGDLSSTLSLNGSLEVEAQINDSTEYRALANYPDGGTVRLIKDGKVYREYELDFYENEPKPDYENGNETPVYSAFTVTASVPMEERFSEGEWQKIEIEVTVIDRFGICYRQIPYVLEAAGNDGYDRPTDTEITYPTK